MLFDDANLGFQTEGATYYIEWALGVAEVMFRIAADILQFLATNVK